MLIAKIIKSNSHVDYNARVLDSFETAMSPQSLDYRFGQFVKVAVADLEVIGIIYNSLLINPEYGNYGPRLSTPAELNTIFSPDYLNEQGILLGILLVGWRDEHGTHQSVPRVVLPINSNVETMSDEEVADFHHGDDGKLRFSYYPDITTHAGAFSYQLISVIINQLEGLTTEREKTRLKVLQQTLTWQKTVSGIK